MHSCYKYIKLAELINSNCCKYIRSTSTLADPTKSTNPNCHISMVTKKKVKGHAR